MSKGPGGKKRPQRDRRPGRAGIGPGPAYRPNPNSGGTKHKGGKTGGGRMCRLGQVVGAAVLLYLATAFAEIAAGLFSW